MNSPLRENFIPCAENNYQPHVLQKVSVGLMAVLILISFSLANVQSFLWMSSEWLVSTILPAVIVDLTNEERGDESVGTLTRSSALDAAATQKAEHMAKNGYFSHYSPDGVSPWYWFDQANYSFVHAGENLAVYFTDSDDVVDAWMESPGHRANILNGAFTDIGVGTAKGTYNGYDTVYVVQLFGTPAATPLATQSIVQEASASAPTETAVPAPATIVETNPVLLGEEAESAALYSDLATTSRDAQPATLSGGSTAGEEWFSFSPSTFFGRIATNPDMVLQSLYAMLAVLVTGSLILSIVIEWRRQHPVQIAYGGALLAGMAFLFYIHIVLTSGAVIA